MTSNHEPLDVLDRVAFSQGSDARQLRIVCWGVALLLGAVQVWGFRHLANSDGISYLDMGDAFSRVGWGALVNAHWSPLYPGLLGLALRILKPSGYWDAPAAHLVNFAIYVGALASFDFFWRTLLSSHRKESPRFSPEGSITLPEWAWLPLGFALFVWTTLRLIDLALLTPDVCVIAFVYLASGLVIRIRMNPAGWRTFFTLGLVLGLGYLAKAPLFPMAFVFLGVSALVVGNARAALPRVSVALLVFLIIACPLVRALSIAHGRLTFGDSARLNYWHFINESPMVNWQGEPSGSGTPEHPTRKILDAPPLYEFATPIKATYPCWYDVPYWNEGMKPHFDIRGQARVLITSLVEYFRIFAMMQGGLIAGTLMLILFGGRGHTSARDIGKQWHLLIPALAGMGMYALVYVESRFLAAYVVLFWAAILSGIRVPGSTESRRVAAAASIAMLVTLGIQVAGRTGTDITEGIADRGKVQCEVAEGLKRLGVQRGDTVASAGDSYVAYWARLAKVSIVAEVPDYSGESFWWAADPQVKAKVFEAFGKTGAKVVVADRMPLPNWSADWQRVGNTSYYVHFLTRP